MSALLIQIIGFTAQILFSSRMLVQWILSEKAQKVLSPLLFWQLSLMASMMLILYSLLIKDVNILIGQCIGFFIYIRNLQLKNYWKSIPLPLRVFILIAPIVIYVCSVLFQTNQEWNFKNYSLDTVWLTVGFVGQMVFSCRFLYQWYYSEKKQKSILPMGFWLISLIGSSIIALYSLKYQLYPILVGHLFGILVYTRNLTLMKKSNG